MVIFTEDQAELVIDPRHVLNDRFLGDRQRPRDRRIAVSLGHQRQDLGLARGERVKSAGLAQRRD